MDQQSTDCYFIRKKTTKFILKTGKFKPPDLIHKAVILELEVALTAIGCRRQNSCRAGEKASFLFSMCTDGVGGRSSSSVSVTLGGDGGRGGRHRSLSIDMLLGYLAILPPFFFFLLLRLRTDSSTSDPHMWIDNTGDSFFFLSSLSVSTTCTNYTYFAINLKTPQSSKLTITI